MIISLNEWERIYIVPSRFLISSVESFRVTIENTSPVSSALFRASRLHDKWSDGGQYPFRLTRSDELWTTLTLFVDSKARANELGDFVTVLARSDTYQDI